MGEVKRISISLKVDTGDETYWSLIEPLQNNRQLSTFIITCLKAYVEDSDIHDAIDMYSRKGSGVDKIREHIENLMKLQAKANRAAEDINSSLGGDTEELEIENMLDEIDEPEEEQEYTEEVVERPVSETVAKTQVAKAQVTKAKSQATTAALPESVDTGALNRIIKRLDSLEQTVGNLSSKVGANSEHISKIEGSRKISEPVNDTTTKTKKETVKIQSKKEEPKSKVEDGKKAAPVKEVKFDDVPDSGEEGSMDFSDLLTGFMDSVQ